MLNVYIFIEHWESAAEADSGQAKFKYQNFN